MTGAAAIAAAALLVTAFILPPVPVHGSASLDGRPRARSCAACSTSTRAARTAPAPSTRWPPPPREPACSSSSSPTTATPRGRPILRPTDPACCASTRSKSARRAGTTRPSDSGRAPYPLAGEPSDVAEDVRRLGGFGSRDPPAVREGRPGVARLGRPRGCHRVAERRQPLARRPLAPGSARAAWTYLVRPVPSIAQLLPATGGALAWDGIDRGRRVIALAGTDAHARLGFSEGPEPYRNPVYLKVAVLRVAFEAGVAPCRPRRGRLAGDAAADAAAIVGAIRKGRVHTVVDGLGRGGGVRLHRHERRGDGGRGRAGAPLRPGRRPGPEQPAARRVGRPVPERSAGAPGSGPGTGLRQRPGRAPTAPRSGRRPSDAPGFVPWIVGNPIVVGPVEPLRRRHRRSRQPGPVVPGRGGRARVGRRARRALAGAGSTETMASACPTRWRRPGRRRPTRRCWRPPTIDRGRDGRRVRRPRRPPDAGLGSGAGSDGGGGAPLAPLRLPRSTAPGGRHPLRGDDRRRGYAPKGPPRVGDVRTLLFVVDLVNAKPGASGRFSLGDVRFFSPGSWTASNR